MPTRPSRRSRRYHAADSGVQLVASPPVSAGSVQLDRRLALRSQHTGGEAGLRQQQRPREPEHAARKFPDRSQDVPGCEEEARNGTHGGEDGTDSAGKETAQERPDTVSGEDTACDTCRRRPRMSLGTLRRQRLLNADRFPIFPGRDSGLMLEGAAELRGIAVADSV